MAISEIAPSECADCRSPRVPARGDHQPSREFHLDFHKIAVAGLAQIAQGDAHFLLPCGRRYEPRPVFVRRTMPIWARRGLSRIFMGLAV